MARRKRKSSGVSDEKESEVKPEDVEEESVDSEDDEDQEGAGFLSSFSRSSDAEEEKVESQSAEDRVPVTSMWPSRLIVTNTPSGERYEWPRAGSTVWVLSADLPFLEQKNRDVRACCGSETKRRYFDL